jgi:hypothetical protein
MFKYYQDAVVCSVYLFDLEKVQDLDYDLGTLMTRCRWFTRGWTLQELLAPQNVVFYDRHWVDCGTKLSLTGTISSLTRIDAVLLSGDTSINHYSVAQRLS